MTNHSSEIRQAVERFLRLVEFGPAEQSEAEVELAYALDGLAWAIRQIPWDLSPDFSIEWPKCADESLLAIAPKRFPAFGYYRATIPLEPGEAVNDDLVGDAVNDVRDITRELLGVRVIWDTIGEPEALWALRFSFESHWEYHLRWLQLYLFHRVSLFGEGLVWA